jgi:hypothetical protein
VCRPSSIAKTCNLHTAINPNVKNETIAKPTTAHKPNIRKTRIENLESVKLTHPYESLNIASLNLENDHEEETLVASQRIPAKNSQIGTLSKHEFAVRKNRVSSHRQHNQS